MQSVFDSVCRCFGTPGQPTGMNDITESASGEVNSPHGTTSGSKPVPSTPDMKRRTRSLKLQDEQWDALFDCNAAGVMATKCGGGATAATAGETNLSMEQARALAKAKLQAHGKPRQRSHKRKRSTAEDIFRSKKSTAAKEAPRPGPFSRFLSNNPVIAHSLCFATPIRDPDEPDVEDYNSVVSESHTLNTAEDTMTSTVYYEQVKLAGLKQNNPPMPLFSAYEIKHGDDIRDVVESETHSSVMMKEWVLKNPQILQVPRESRLTPPASPNRYEDAAVATPPAVKEEEPEEVEMQVDDEDDDAVPPMVNSSSSGTASQRSI